MSIKKAFSVFADCLRRMASGMQEPTKVEIEDYVLEHFLLYNGLVGSTPEDELVYRDVRNDIVQSVNDGSAHELAIALKLSPLRWADRLEKIFSDVALVNREGAIKCLSASPQVGDITGDTACLTHSDWQVRANAASMLAFLGDLQAVPALVKLLEQCSDAYRPAFCHVAYSLARLGSEPARQALVNQLANREPWFCVDAAGALSDWDISSVGTDLMSAMLAGSVLDDYMAVAIARRHGVAEFAQCDDDLSKEGTCELALCLIKALRGVFHAEAQIGEQLQAAQIRINELAVEKPTPRRLLAAIELNDWIDSTLPSSKDSESSESADRAEAALLIRDISNAEHYESVRRTLAEPAFESAPAQTQFEHALTLASRFKLHELAPYLIPLVPRGFPALPQLLECIGSLGDPGGAPIIARLVEQTVDLDKRCSQPLAANPVIEADKELADVYWSALQALGCLPDPAAVEILRQAVNDYAPDKRERALLSLQAVMLHDELKTYPVNLEQLIRERISDPATGVQAAALLAVANHRFVSLAPEVLKALQSNERSVQKQASETLRHLALEGSGTMLEPYLIESLRKERSVSGKQRLSQALQEIRELSK